LLQINDTWQLKISTGEIKSSLLNQQPGELQQKHSILSSFTISPFAFCRRCSAAIHPNPTVTNHPTADVIVLAKAITDFQPKLQFVLLR
jgi:hypothetical protein